MYMKLLVVLIALPLLVSTTRTICERYEGNKEIRCKKDGYGADEICIKNIANTTITFRVSKWMSNCDTKSVKYSDEIVTLESGKQKIVPFSEATAGTCNELYVGFCKRKLVATGCVDIVEVYPQLALAQTMLEREAEDNQKTFFSEVQSCLACRRLTYVEALIKDIINSGNNYI